MKYIRMQLKLIWNRRDSLSCMTPNYVKPFPFWINSFPPTFSHVSPFQLLLPFPFLCSRLHYSSLPLPTSTVPIPSLNKKVSKERGFSSHGEITISKHNRKYISRLTCLTGPAAGNMYWLVLVMCVWLSGVTSSVCLAPPVSDDEAMTALIYNATYTSLVLFLYTISLTWRPLLPYGTAIKHPVPDRVKRSFVIFDIPGTLTLTAERQSARMSKITNDGGLTRSDTGCFIAVPI